MPWDLGKIPSIDFNHVDVFSLSREISMCKKKQIDTDNMLNLLASSVSALSMHISTLVSSLTSASWVLNTVNVTSNCLLPLRTYYWCGYNFLHDGVYASHHFFCTMVSTHPITSSARRCLRIPSLLLHDGVYASHHFFCTTVSTHPITSSARRCLRIPSLLLHDGVYASHHFFCTLQQIISEVIISANYISTTCCVNLGYHFPDVLVVCSTTIGWDHSTTVYIYNTNGQHHFIIVDSRCLQKLW